MFARKRIAVLTLLLTLVSAVESLAACGPPECCAFPRKCGKGPEFSRFYSEELECQTRAAYSVGGRLARDPRGYPDLVIVDGTQIAAEVWWFRGACTVKYRPGFFQQ